MFFEGIKDNIELPGMVITYNCMLDLYSLTNQFEEAINLFYEIEDLFSADLITYSTLIKGLC